MPLQNYRCRKCGESFQVFRSSFYGYAEDERLVCPKCRSSEVEQVSSPRYGNEKECGGSCQDSRTGGPSG